MYRENNEKVYNVMKTPKQSLNNKHTSVYVELESAKVGH